MTGICTVTIAHTLNRRGVRGATITARLIDRAEGPAASLLSLQVTSARTGDPRMGWPAGYAELALIRRDFFTVGDGLYEFTVTEPDGTVSCRVIRTVPAQDSAPLAALVGGDALMPAPAALQAAGSAGPLSVALTPPTGGMGIHG